MATHPHDDQPKTPNVPGKKSPPTPKQPIPNMSLDDEEPLEIEEFVDAEVVEAEPVRLADEDADDEDAIEVEPVAEEGAAPVEARPLTPAATSSEPDFGKLAEASAPPPAQEWSFEDAVAEEIAKTPPAPEGASPAPPSDVTPASDVLASGLAEDISETPSAAKQQAPASDVLAEIMAAEGAETPSAAKAPVDAAHVDAAPASDVLAEMMAGEAGKAPSAIETATPASDVFAAEEAEEVAEAVSAVEAEEIAEASPASDVLAGEEAVEVVEAVSAVEAEEVEEAMPASAVLADEGAEEVAEAVSAVEAEEVLGDEEVEEAMPASQASAVEEVSEAIEDVSSATRKSEAVLDDELAQEVGSDAVQASSGVIFDEPTMADSGAKARDFDKTVAFDTPTSSGRKKAADDEFLVTEEELAGSAEASAVNLGDMPRKGSSVTGIDKVAEALESGTDIAGDTGKTAPSVEFDELLDDLSGSDEGPLTDSKKEVEEPTDTEGEALEEAKKKGKKKAEAKATGDDIDLDAIFDDDVAEAKAEEAEEVAEAAEAEAADAEAAAAFADEEVDGEETRSKGKGKKGKAAALVADEAMADADEDEKLAKGKKKAAFMDDEAEEVQDEEDARPRKKEKATVAPAAQPSMALRWLGGMIVGGFLLFTCMGAGAFFAPDQVRDAINMVAGPPAKPNIPQPPKVEKTKLALAHEAMGQQNYQAAVTELKDASEPMELNARGEARWFAYVKQQSAKSAPLDKDAADVKEAIADLTKAKNDLMVAQINAALKEKELDEQLTVANTAKTKAETELKTALAARDKADKAIDAVADVLVKSNVIKDKADLSAAKLQTIIKSLNDDRAVLDKVNKLLEQEVKGTAEDGLKKVIELKKQSDMYVAAVTKALESAKVKSTDAKGVQELAAERDTFQGESKNLNDLIAKAFKPLVDGKIVEAGADPRKDLVRGVTLARERAESPLTIPLTQLGTSLGSIGSGTSKLVEDSFNMARTVSELGWFRTREEFIQTPQQKLTTNTALLQDRTQADSRKLKAILRETDWILAAESKSDADARAQAEYVKGLVLRNQGKFAEARKAFTETLKKADSIKTAGAWIDQLADSHKELTDANFYYIPRIDKLRSTGDLQGALAEADAALAAMPGDANLFARRALIRYEQAQGGGPKGLAAAQAPIRADAQAAAKDQKLAAESAFIIGLVEEGLGKLDVAEKQFRMAIKLHDDAEAPADDAGKYRVALGRLLLRERLQAAPAAPELEKKEVEKKKDDDKGARQLAPGNEVCNTNSSETEITIHLHPWSLLVVAHTVAQPNFEELEDKETLARLKEVMDEAEKLKASKNPKLQGQGHLLMGAALSKLGKRTDGLKEYAKGLELLYPGIETTEINELIVAHPAFQQPDVSSVPNPIMAERHFGEGMHTFWKAALNPTAPTAQQDFKDAESQFRQAIQYYDKDARYQYYLGFAQLQQKTKAKRDSAIYAFELGARLEARAVQANPFATREINQSLERVQGEMRQLLNQYRYRPATEPETTKTEVQ